MDLGRRPVLDGVLYGSLLGTSPKSLKALAILLVLSFNFFFGQESILNRVEHCASHIGGGIINTNNTNTIGSSLELLVFWASATILGMAT
jgi:hypothetical protein